VVDEHFEGARAVAVVELGAGGVEAVTAVVAGVGEDVVVGDVDDGCVRVDEAADEPRASDAVGLGAGAGDPVHGCSLMDGSACWRPGALR
jgi:hypothetical protein